MRKLSTSALALMMLSGSALAATSAPAPVTLGSLEHRLARIERVMDNKILLDLLQRVESLQSEIRELRGEIESQGFEQRSLKKRQRDLYLDTDRRLRELELGAPPKPATGTAPQGSIAPAPTGTGSSAGAAPAPAGGSLADEKRAYEQAFKYLEEALYPDAVTAFGQFVQRYPNGSYAGHAQYWQGEAHYVSKQFDEAVAAFNQVLQRFPASPKVADARLKLGYAHYELKQWDQARNILQKLASDFPNTAVARLASKRLQRIKQDGH